MRLLVRHGLPMYQSTRLTADIKPWGTCRLSEYIIRKYANGRSRPPASGELDDLYCTSYKSMTYSLYGSQCGRLICILLDTHIAEGSLMPLIVNNLIMGILTERTPWLLRPIVGFLMNKLRGVIVEPGLRTYAQLARNSPHPSLKQLTISTDRKTFDGGGRKLDCRRGGAHGRRLYDDLPTGEYVDDAP